MPSYSGVWTLAQQLQAIGGQNWPMGPGAPTSVSASAGDTQATVTFVAPTFTGVPPGITGYLATSTPGSLTASGASSPLTITGLTNGTSYTIAVQATNGVQYGPAGTSGSVSPSPPIGLFAGGGGDSNSNIVDKITISTTGNATDFGDLTQEVRAATGLSSATRAVRSGGTITGVTNTIDYGSFSSSGNFVDFGDMTVNRATFSGVASSTRGVNMFGQSNTISMDYITIASTGNATFFGDSYFGGGDSASSGVSSPTRGVAFRGGFIVDGRTNVIEYITIATTGNSVDFGDQLFRSLAVGASCSNETRGILFGGYSFEPTEVTNVIQYITIASTGNSTDFGDLTSVTYFGGALASSSRGVFGGGDNLGNVMQYITIASTGNAADFGDLTHTNSRNVCGMSSSHGGLS